MESDCGWPKFSFPFFFSLFYVFHFFFFLFSCFLMIMLFVCDKGEVL